MWCRCSFNTHPLLQTCQKLLSTIRLLLAVLGLTIVYIHWCCSMMVLVVAVMVMVTVIALQVMAVPELSVLSPSRLRSCTRLFGSDSMFGHLYKALGKSLAASVG
jgi:hypothetical protein